MRQVSGLRRTTKISLGLSAFLIGLCLARLVDPGSYFLLVGISIIFASIRRSPIVHVAGIVFFGLLLGLWRGSIFMDRLRIYQDYSKKFVTIQATAASDSVYGDKGQLSFEAGSVKMIDPIDQKLAGKIGVKGYGESMVYRGDTVEVSAKLYPTRGSKQASMGFAKITRTKVGTSIIDTLRRDFAAGLQSVLPEPLGSFGLGILIGQRTTLPQNLNDQLSATGLTHIVAVSGYNLTIIVLFVHRLAKNRSKFQSTALTIALIGIFLMLTGSSASIVRAAIVSLLSLWAWYFGRNFRPAVLLLLAAVLTAGWFPPYIWSDIGWYLSFLAFTGVLVVAPLLTRRIMSARKPKILTSVFIETFSAQIMTLPIIMYIFGRLSLVAIVSNMLVVPLVPLAMGLCFIAGAAAMIAPALAGWVAWPATLLMTYMVDVVQVLAGLPHASLEQKINTLQLAAGYMIIVFVLLVWWRKSTPSGKIKVLNPVTTESKI